SLIPSTAKVSLEELSKRISESGQQELRIIIKGDVQGSVEALADTLAKLSTEKVRLAIIHAGVGAITEGDINLAIAAKAIVKRFKDDVKEVVEGFECGISFEDFNDVKEKDVIECYEIEEIKQKL